MTEFYDVFISYRRSDGYEIADTIYNYLTRKGLRVFLDREKMVTGQYFDEQIREHVVNSPFYIFIGTNDAFKFRTEEKDFVEEEMRLAVNEYEKNRESRIILPVIPNNAIIPSKESFPEGTYQVMLSDGINLRGNVPNDNELRIILETISRVSRVNLWHAGKRWYENSRKPGSRFSCLSIDERIFPQASNEKVGGFAALPINVYEKNKGGNGKEEKEERKLFDAISKIKKHSYLIGQGGIGKTTALFSLMKEAYDGKTYSEGVQIPLFVELSHAPDTDGMLYSGQKSTFIRRAIYQQIRSDKKVKQVSTSAVGKIDDAFMIDPDIAVVPVTNLLTKETNSPEYLLLLDGLNEVSRTEIEEENNKSVVSMIIWEIEWLIDNCPNVQIVLTSRSDETAINSKSVTKLYLSGVDDKIIKSYLKENGKDEDEVNRVLDSSNLLETLRIPLFLTMYAKIEETAEVNTQGEIFRQFFNEKSSGITDYTLQNRIEEVEDDVRNAASKTQKKRISAAAQHFMLDFLIPEIAFRMEQNEEFYIKNPKVIREIIISVLTGREDTDVCGEFGKELFDKYNVFRKDTETTAEEFCNQFDNNESLIRKVVLECCIYTMGILQKTEHGIGFVHHHLRDYFAAVRNINSIRLALYLYEMDEEETARECIGYMKERPLSVNVCRFIGEALHEYSNIPKIDDAGRKHYNVPAEVCDRNLLKRALDMFRGRFDGEDGYTVYSLVLSMTEGRQRDLCGEDFSSLDLRHCSFEGIMLGDCGCGANLKDSLLSKSCFFPKGHTSNVNSASYSLDGRYIVSVSDDNTIKIWDTRTYELVKTLQGHKLYVTSVSYSPDGRYIVSTSWDRTLKIWDACTYELVKTIVAHAGRINSASYSPDGICIASACGNGTIKIWDSRTYELINTLKGHIDVVSSVSYSPDGRYIVSGSRDKTIKIWDNRTYKLINTLEGHTDVIESVSYSPDGRYIVSGSWDKTIKIWDSRTYELVKTLEGHADIVNSVSFRHDGRCIVSTSSDNTVKIWDTRTQAIVKTFEGYTNAVSSVSYSPDGRYIVSGSWDKTIKIWDSRTYELVKSFEGHTDNVESVSYSPDGKYIVSSSLDKTIKIWDVGTYGLLKTLEGHTSDVFSAIYSPDGEYIASASWDGTIKIWDSQTYKLVRTLNGHTARVNSVAYSPDGRYIVSGSYDETVKIWDTSTYEILMTIGGHSSFVLNVGYSPDGRHIVSASYDKTIELWDIYEIKLEETLNGHADEVNSALYSCNGEYIVSASADNTVKIWNARTYELVKTLEGHTSDVFGALYSPDGKYILSVSNDGTIKVWDVKTFNCIQTIPNIYGLNVMDCDMTELHPDSDISEDARNKLRIYGVKI